MQLVIIAGGKGTRLGLKDIPKPMVQIAGKPLLEHQIELAKRYGIDEFFILSGHLSNIIEDYFGNGEKWGVKIYHIIEPFPLGTAGSVKLLEGKIKDRFMVFYGDVVMDFDINSFIKFDSQKDSVGTVIVHPNDHPHDSDLLEIDDENKVINVFPKPHKDDKHYQNLVNAAVYIFSPKIFDYIEKDTSSDFGKNILPKIIDNNGILMAYSTPEYIKDMGTSQRFEKVSDDFTSGKVTRLNKQNPRPAIFLDRDGVINKDMDTNPIAENFEFLNGAIDAIKEINKSDFLSVVVTNQPMIAKGFVTFEDVYNTHKKMETILGQNGAYLNKIYFCPHHNEKGFKGEIKELKIDCNCRKPKSGMLLKAQKELNIDLKNSWMIGDKESDIIAGKNAGCKTIFICDKIEKSIGSDFACSSLKEAIKLIMDMKR